jgi:uncharacterized repeat protein (TIGR03803 family)
MRPMKSCKFLTPVLFALLLTCLSLPTRAQTYKVLHTFTGAPSDGAGPIDTLARDSAGNLYGTTEGGGSGVCGQFSCGTVFALSKTGRELGVFSFNGEDGDAPAGGLFRDAVGNLYGTTQAGGAHSCQNGSYSAGCGTVFQLSKTGKIRYYSFSGQPDGEFPDSTPVEFSGSLYGTTSIGGSLGLGTIYKIDGRGRETVLYSFKDQSDGCDPDPGVTVDSKGNLYGVTFDGGSGGSCNNSYGTAYELDVAGNFTVLYGFGGHVGANPDAALILDSQGNLYGTAKDGGNSDDGTVFELSPGNNGIWSGRALYSFCSLPLCADGDGPLGGVVRDVVSGNIYGTTFFGGAYGGGTVFQLTPSGQETVLYSFTGGTDGAYPFGGLTLDASGNLYGTNTYGGDTSCNPPSGCGVVFELTP